MVSKSNNKEQVFPVYFLYGTEPYVIQNYYNNLITNIFLDSNNIELNLHIFNHETLDFKLISQNIMSIPFLSSKKCVVIKDIKLEKLTNADLILFENILKEMPNTSHIIFYNLSLINSNIRNFKEINRIISKYSGKLLRFKIESRHDVYNYVIDHILVYNVKISNAVINKIIDNVGLNLNYILNEVEKLTNYVIKGSIKVEHLSGLATQTLYNSAFDLSKSIIRGDIANSLNLLDELIEVKTDPIVILSAISSVFIDLYRSKLCQINNVSLDYLLHHLDYLGKEFKIKNAYKLAFNISYSYLTKCIDILTNLDLKLKTYKINSTILLESSIIKIIVSNLK